MVDDAKEIVGKLIRLDDVLDVIADQKAVFASEEYATGQPLSSFRERFACDRISAAIIALSLKETVIVSNADTTPKRGDKLVWARALERRPIAVTDLEHVTVASWGLPSAPLAVTLEEVAGTFPMGWFDRALLHKEQCDG